MSSILRGAGEVCGTVRAQSDELLSAWRLDRLEVDVLGTWTPRVAREVESSGAPIKGLKKSHSDGSPFGARSYSRREEPEERGKLKTEGGIATS